MGERPGDWTEFFDDQDEAEALKNSNNLRFAIGFSEFSDDSEHEEEDHEEEEDGEGGEMELSKSDQYSVRGSLNLLPS